MNKIEKYIPYIIGIVLLGIGLPYALKLFKTAKGSAEATNDFVNNVSIDKGVSDKTGIPVASVGVCRDIAYKISMELETNKGMSYTDKLTHIVTDSKIISIMNGYNDVNEAKLISSFYKTLFTDNASLYDDIKDALNWNSDFIKIPFISSIK